MEMPQYIAGGKGIVMDAQLRDLLSRLDGTLNFSYSGSV